MIQIKYKTLFELEFLHPFYTLGKCPDIVLMPTVACNTIMQYFGLRFLPTDFGGKVFARVTTDGRDVLKSPLTNGTKLSFVLKLSNPLFENFTNLDAAKLKGSHYYFNNLTENISADNSPLLVSNTAGKTVSNADVIPFISNSFSYIHNSTAATAHSQLTFIDSGETFLQALDNNNNIFNFSYDLTRTGGGRAKFLIEGAETTSFYVIDPTDSANAFGVVEIFYSDALPATYQFQKADKSADTKLYKIAFANRFTKWRYIVSKQFNQLVSSINIGKANGTTIGFTTHLDTASGQFISSSNNALPLQQQPVADITLKDQDSKTIINNLPNPSFNIIKQEGADLFSDILITI